MSAEQIGILFKKYFEKTSTMEERDELMALIQEAAHDEHLKSLLEKTWAAFKPVEMVFSDKELDEIYRKILNKPVGRVISMETRKIGFPIRRIAIAAVILILAGAAIYFLSTRNPNKNGIASNKKTDVKAPQSNKATLTLADGRVIVLDNEANGPLRQAQGPDNEQLTIVKQGDQISYQSSVGSEQSAVSYNTLSIPKGSKPMQLKLADGTMVWLDAATSITYPTSFPGNERKLTIKGQSYFEVAHNALKPFKVNIPGKGEVEVLGTHFNVDAFDDESATKVTLLEGKVRINGLPTANSQPFDKLRATPPTILNPGQQAQISDQIKVTDGIDVGSVMAWKNGFFDFNNANIKDIMRQAARWYDIEVAYEGKITTERFKGRIARTTNLSELMKILELNGVKWRVDGKKVIIE